MPKDSVTLTHLTSDGPVSETYRVGDLVWVRARGKVREGRVVKLNRTTVVVDHERNANGGREERAHPGAALRKRTA